MSMIQQISGMIPNAAQPPAAASGVKGPQNIQQSGEAASVRSRTPVTDEYAPEEKREPAGLYWLGKDENGQPKLCFDDPERVADKPQKPDEASGTLSPDKKADGDKRAAGDKKEVCTGSTDQVDREIERLKRKLEELERRISAETDESKMKALEQKQAQVERELNQKDNDTYRRQHTVFS